jgi:hypothetical protein
MRIATLLAAPVFAIALAACTERTPEVATPDPAAAQATTDSAVAAALAGRDADDVKLHGDAGPAVYIANLRDGQTVPTTFRVVFGLYGDMGVAPALTDKPKTGHHHLLIDTELSEDEMQYAIPKDDKHLHFGAGQTETVLNLPAGPHTLQLVFGDMNHELHKPAAIMSEKITVNVQ